MRGRGRLGRCLPGGSPYPGAPSLEAWQATWDAREEAHRRGVGKARAGQCRLLRCVFGNPFHAVTLNPSWLTPAVVSLAEAAYGQRDLPSGHLDLRRLAVLADALEEAGCTAPEILGHLRDPRQVHVRGCWALDAVLERE